MPVERDFEYDNPFLKRPLPYQPGPVETDKGAIYQPPPQVSQPPSTQPTSVTQPPAYQPPPPPPPPTVTAPAAYQPRYGINPPEGESDRVGVPRYIPQPAPAPVRPPDGDVLYRQPPSPLPVSPTIGRIGINPPPEEPLPLPPGFVPPAMQPKPAPDAKDWEELPPFPPGTAWPGGSPPWSFDEQYGGPNPNYTVVNGKVYRRINTGTPKLSPGGIKPPAPISADPNPEYLSDIAALRGMPQGLVDAYRKYIESAQQQPKSAPLIEQELKRLQTLPARGQYEQDISYLRADPGSEGIDASYLTSARENVENRFKAAQGNIMRQASMRGIEPTSGVIQDQLRQLEEAKVKEMATADRELAMWKIGERRSRLGESRSVADRLEELTSGRAGRGIELGDRADASVLGRRGLETSLFRELDAQEQARRAGARGIERELDQDERQRLMDLIGIIQGSQPSSMPAQITGANAANAANIAAGANAQFGDILGGMGQSALYYALLNNPELFKSLTGIK